MIISGIMLNYFCVLIIIYVAHTWSTEILNIRNKKWTKTPFDLFRFNKHVYLQDHKN